MLATHLLTHTFQHTLFDWLKFLWDPPNSYGTHQIHMDPNDLVGPMWILTNQRECVEKCVLEDVLLVFLQNHLRKRGFEYDDKIKTMYKNKSSTLNKKFTNETYLTIQQLIHNPNHKTNMSQTKTIYNKSH